MLRAEGESMVLNWQAAFAKNETYCVCHGSGAGCFMLCCERCEKWFHGVCVGLHEDLHKNVLEQDCEFVCRACNVEKDGNGEHAQAAKSDKTGAPNALNQASKKRKQPKVPQLLIGGISVPVKPIVSDGGNSNAKVELSSQIVPIWNDETKKVLRGADAPTVRSLPFFLAQNKRCYPYIAADKLHPDCIAYLRSP